MDRKEFLKTGLLGTVAAVGTVTAINAAGNKLAAKGQKLSSADGRTKPSTSKTASALNSDGIELLPAYFTISGDIHPFGPTEVSPFEFKDRVEAAAKAGYKGFGLIRDDILHYEKTIGLKEMKRILDTHGITKIEFEFLGGWFSKGKERKFSDQYKKDLLRAADVLKPVNIKIAPQLHVDESNNDMPLMVNEFKKLAQEAADHGTNIVLEIMPFSNVRTIDTALAIVQGADHPNGGLLLDIWHLTRGGIDFTEISRIPLKYIKSIELNDAEKYAVSPLWQDTIHRRTLPGEGVFDVKGFIKAVKATGYKGHWGVEVLSSKLRKMSLEDMAQKTFNATIAQFS